MNRLAFHDGLGGDNWDNSQFLVGVRIGDGVRKTDLKGKNLDHVSSTLIMFLEAAGLPLGSVDYY